MKRVINLATDAEFQGAAILNVSGAAKTADIVHKIRKEYPEIPIIATGGRMIKAFLELSMPGQML